jgi:hypothetical protein
MHRPTGNLNKIDALQSLGKPGAFPSTGSWSFVKLEIVRLICDAVDA